MLWMMGVALAQDGAVFGILQIPITPHDSYRDTYHTLIKEKEAEGKDWSSDTPGFLCTGAGDFVELRVTRGTWPVNVPKKVTCTSGKDKAAAKIVIRDQKLKPMFVGQGTVVLPRLKGETAHYQGPGPRTDLVVGLGKTQGLPALCKAKPNGIIDVTASGDHEDGEGQCLFRTPLAEVIPVPFVVRTVK